LLDTTFAGKLLMALVCEYFEWCELEHTLKVFLPELNQVLSYFPQNLSNVLPFQSVSIWKFSLALCQTFKLGKLVATSSVLVTENQF
jgi:hypothetical protein